MVEFVMPSLGADMEAGTLVEWCKAPGDAISRGEVIAEIDTDKGLIEVECFTDGIIEKFLLEPGERVPVGTPMALIRAEAEFEATAAIDEKPVIIAPAASPEKRVVASQPESTGRRLRISPAAKKMAEELGIDPATVTGTGPGGRIVTEDIEQVIAEQKASVAPPAATPDRNERMRQAIAAAMSRSKREIPHYYLSTTIDLQYAMNWLEAANLQRPVTERLLSGVLFIKAVALALREYPEFNATWEQGQLQLKNEINIGVAISLRQGGLVAPALHGADQQSLDELMKNLLDLVKRARVGGLRSSEMAESTITITSLGDQGVDSVFGIIFPPQVALVGFGRIVERPWVVRGEIAARPVVTASLAADHRASDGHRGGLFLSTLDRLLQEPEKL